MNIHEGKGQTFLYQNGFQTDCGISSVSIFLLQYKNFVAK